MTEPHRGLDKRTLDSYGVGFKDGHIVFHYRNKSGIICAQKIRALEPGADGKRMTAWRGAAKEVSGFGMHLANPAKHKQICICEGELDAPSIYQAFSGKVAAVSVPNGAQNAAAFVKKTLDEFLKFESIVVCTDNDDAGNAAATNHGSV